MLAGDRAKNCTFTVNRQKQSSKAGTCDAFKSIITHIVGAEIDDVRLERTQGVWQVLSQLKKLVTAGAAAWSADLSGHGADPRRA
jgi:hypothetical protein